MFTTLSRAISKGGNAKGGRVSSMTRWSSTLTSSTSSQGIPIITTSTTTTPPAMTSTVAIVFKAGARHDPVSAPGMAHVWQSSLVRTTPDETIVKAIRETEFRGDSLYTSLTREHLVLASDFLRDDLVDAVPSLLKHAFNTHMFGHEFIESREHAVEQSKAALEDPKAKVLDRLHQVAFRTGLGNPLFASTEGAEALNRSKLQEWAKAHFNPNSMAIIGRGVDHGELKALVEEMENPYPKSAAPAPVAKPAFFSGEARLETGPESDAHVALAYPAPALSSPDYAAALVLRALLDGSKHSPWGSVAGVTGLLAPLSTSSTTTIAFATAYTDAGLLGFYVHAEAGGDVSEVKSILTKSMGALKAVATGSASVSPEAIARAKKSAIVTNEADKSRLAAILELATSSLSGTALAEAVAKVTLQDVARVAATACKAKPAMVCMGNLRALPHLDQL